MTDIEQKALALLNEVLAERVHWQMTGTRAENASLEALCRAIEQHEAFQQEVSDALVWYFGSKEGCVSDALRDFIIPAPKPDPLEEVLYGVWFSDPKEDAKALRAALEARGLEIRSKNDD